MSAKLRQRFGRELAARSSYDAAFNFALAAVAIAAVLHMVWFVASFFAFRRRIDAATMVIVDWDPAVIMMHIRIGLALLLSVIGLWSRRVIGLFLSALALVWVGLEYIAWLLWSIRIKSNAGIEIFPSSVSHREGWRTQSVFITAKMIGNKGALDKKGNVIPERVALEAPRSGWDDFDRFLKTQGVESPLKLSLDKRLEPDPDEELIAIETKSGAEYSMVYFSSHPKNEDGKRAWQACELIEREFRVKLGCAQN